MKLLIDCHVFDGKYQGTRTYLEGLYKEMIKHQDMEFYFAASDIDRLKSVFGEADNIHYVKLSAGGRLKRLSVEFPNIIRSYQIDYAHFQYISPLVKRCKEIVTVHDLLFLDFPKYFPLSYRLKNGFLFWKSACRADVLLTVSDYSKDEIHRHFRIAKNKIGVTYNGVLLPEEDLPKTDVRERFDLRKYILTVSRIEPRKNHISLLKAFVEMNLYNEGYKLVFVGGYDWSNREFDDYFNSLNSEVKSNVLMLSASYPELVDLYRNASLFVFPSFGEGFGIPPIEALAFDCPVLCSNATAMAEFGLPDDMTFNPHDLDEMKQKMRQILQNKIDVSYIRDIVLRKYSWKNSADVLYNNIIENMARQIRYGGDCLKSLKQEQ